MSFRLGYMSFRLGYVNLFASLEVGEEWWREKAKGPLPTGLPDDGRKTSSWLRPGNVSAGGHPGGGSFVPFPAKPVHPHSDPCMACGTLHHSYLLATGEKKKIT